MRSGQTVHIHARLRKGSDYGFVAVFSAAGGGDPAPHVASHKAAFVRSGKPEFLTPTTIRLTRQAKPEHKLVITADENCNMYLMQELDTAKDIRANGRMKINGSRIQTILAYARRWLYGDA